MRRGQKRILAGLAGLILGAVSVAGVSAAAPDPGEGDSHADTGGAALGDRFGDTDPDADTVLNAELHCDLYAFGDRNGAAVADAGDARAGDHRRHARCPTDDSIRSTPDVTVLPALPEPLDPLPDATQSAPPFWGWYSFESDHPVISYGGAEWLPMLAADASRGQYHRTEDMRGYARFPFVGVGLRVRYVAARNMGIVRRRNIRDTNEGWLRDTFPNSTPQFQADDCASRCCARRWARVRRLTTSRAARIWAARPKNTSAGVRFPNAS